MRWRWPVRVQRVVMAVTGAESWTVVDDKWVPVGPVERYLAHLVGAAGACGRLGRRLMLSAVPARSGHGDHLGELVAAVRPEFCGEVIAVSPEDPVFGRGRGGVVRAGAAPGRGICALLTTNGGPTTPSPTSGSSRRRRCGRCRPPTRRPDPPTRHRSATAPPHHRATDHVHTRRPHSRRVSVLALPPARSASRHRPAPPSCHSSGCPRSITSTRINRIAATTPRGCLPSTRSPDSKPTTTNSKNTSPNTSATGATTASPRRQRHVSHMKPKLRTTTASRPPDKNQQPAPSAQAHRPRVHQPTQLRSPRHPRDIMTQPVPATLNPTNTRRAEKQHRNEEISPLGGSNQPLQGSRIKLWGLAGVQIVRPILHQLLAPVEPDTPVVGACNSPHGVPEGFLSEVWGLALVAAP